MNESNQKLRFKSKGSHLIIQNGIPMKMLLNLFRNFGQSMKSIDLDQDKFGKEQNNLPLGANWIKLFGS